MIASSVAVDLEEFNHSGYFVARKLLDSELDLQPVRDEYSSLLDELATQWHADGKLSSAYGNLPFAERLCRVIADGQDVLRYFDIVLPSDASHDTPIHLGPAVFNLLRNPRILDVLEQLIGGEIYSNPVQHIRIKPPERMVPQTLLNGLTAAVGWHQDMGVVTAEADNTNMVSVWIAVLDATVENGCLQVIPGSHAGELRLHCNYDESKRRYYQVNIPEQLVGPGRQPIPMKAGDVLFFQNKLIHSSLPNQSNSVRWSFDLRYNPVGQPSGRPWLPGFVARSRANPDSELRDPAAWAQLWRDARNRLASGQGIRPASRWNSDHPLCA